MCLRTLENSVFLMIDKCLSNFVTRYPWNLTDFINQRIFVDGTLLIYQFHFYYKVVAATINRFKHYLQTVALKFFWLCFFSVDDPRFVLNQEFY